MCIRSLTNYTCSEPLIGAHHVVAVGADMVDILQSINAEGDQTATPGVCAWGWGVGGCTGEGGSVSITLS
jgi:hypothetical protein